MRVTDKLLELIKLQLAARMKTRVQADHKLVTEEMTWRACAKLGDGSEGGLALREGEVKPAPRHWTGLGALQKMSPSVRLERKQQGLSSVPGPQENCEARTNVAEHMTDDATGSASSFKQKSHMAWNFKFSWKDVALLLTTLATVYLFWPAFAVGFKMVSQGLFVSAAVSFFFAFLWPLLVLAVLWFLVCYALQWDCMCELFHATAWWFLQNPSAWPGAVLALFMLGTGRIQFSIVLQREPDDKSGSVCCVGLVVPSLMLLNKQAAVAAAQDAPSVVTIQAGGLVLTEQNPSGRLSETQRDEVKALIQQQVLQQPDADARKSPASCWLKVLLYSFRKNALCKQYARGLLSTKQSQPLRPK